MIKEIPGVPARVSYLVGGAASIGEDHVAYTLNSLRGTLTARSGGLFEKEGPPDVAARI